MESVTILSLKDQVAAALRAEIVSGRLADGEELRQEEIAARLGVSRIPVREALQQLQAEGLVLRLPNRHIRVVGLDTRRLRLHCSALAALEGELVVQALRSGLELPADAGGSALHAAFAQALDDPTLCQLFLQQRRALFETALEACPSAPGPAPELDRAIVQALRGGEAPLRQAVRDYYDTMADYIGKELAL